MDIEIFSLNSVNGLPFGTTVEDAQSVLGLADRQLENYTGELEMLYGDCFYRFFENRLVEATFPDRYRFNVDGIIVLSIFDWLKGLGDVVDMAKFRISLSHGIAYDYRNPAQGSITVFEAGRWDALVLGGADQI